MDEGNAMKRMAFLGGAELLLALFTGCAGTYVGVDDYGYYNEHYYYPYYGDYYYDSGIYLHGHYGGGHHGGGHGHGGGHHH